MNKVRSQCYNNTILMLLIKKIFTYNIMWYFICFCDLKIISKYNSNKIIKLFFFIISYHIQFTTIFSRMHPTALNLISNTTSIINCIITLLTVFL